MPKKIVNVEVESSAYDLGKELGKIVAAVIAKKPWTEILGAEVAQFGLIAADIQAVNADLAENKSEFYEGAALGLKDGFFPAAV